MNAVEQDEALVHAEQGDRVELVRLARYANAFPSASFAPVLALSVLPRVETAEAFDRMRGHLARGEAGLAEQAAAELLGVARFTPGQRLRAEPWGACYSCGSRNLVFAYPDPDGPDLHAMVRCDNADGHVSGTLTFARAWSALVGGAR